VVDPSDPELLAAEATDEFAGYFAGEKTPKIMITTKPQPSAPLFKLIAEMMQIFPNSFYYKRGQHAVLSGLFAL
jgi:ribosome production factor 1